MKLENLDQELHDGLGKKLAELTTRKVLHVAAAQLLNKEEPSDSKYKLGVIAYKIGRAKRAVVLSTEEVKLLKDRVALLFSPEVVMLIHDILEQKQPLDRRKDFLAEIDPEEDEPAKKD